jgi:hypothetical protein
MLTFQSLGTFFTKKYFPNEIITPETLQIPPTLLYR